VKNVVVTIPERYNVPKVLYVPVKPEDLDWIVYHLILAGKVSDTGTIVQETGCTPEEAAGTVRRLVSYFLIDSTGGRFSARSVPEMLLLCQCRYADDSPVIIEDGVVKPKKQGE